MTNLDKDIRLMRARLIDETKSGKKDALIEIVVDKVMQLNGLTGSDDIDKDSDGYGAGHSYDEDRYNDRYDNRNQHAINFMAFLATLAEENHPNNPRNMQSQPCQCPACNPERYASSRVIKVGGVMATMLTKISRGEIDPDDMDELPTVHTMMEGDTDLRACGDECECSNTCMCKMGDEPCELEDVTQEASTG